MFEMINEFNSMSINELHLLAVALLEKFEESEITGDNELSEKEMNQLDWLAERNYHQ